MVVDGGAVLVVVGMVASAGCVVAAIFRWGGKIETKIDTGFSAVAKQIDELKNADRDVRRDVDQTRVDTAMHGQRLAALEADVITVRRDRHDMANKLAAVHAWMQTQQGRASRPSKDPPDSE